MADPHIKEHASLIKTPKQLAVVVLLSFLVPVLALVLLVHLITGGLKVDHDSAAMTEEAIASRLKPVGEVVLAETAAAAGSRSGEAIYKLTCSVCHDAGLLNSPKTGDAGAWKKRIAQGEKTLVMNAIQGIRQMPARGGNPDLTNNEVERAVIYMANKSGASLKQPAAPVQAPAPSIAAAPVATAPATSATAAVAPVAAVAKSSTAAGEKTYNAACSICHAAGLAGAPKTGDTTAWRPRIALGMDALYRSALNGKNAMPPKGGALSLPDADIKAAVDYMIAKAR